MGDLIFSKMLGPFSDKMFNNYILNYQMYNPIPGQTYKTDNFSIDLRTMKQPVITEDYIDLEFNGETIWKNEGCNLEQKEPLTFIDIE